MTFRPAHCPDDLQLVRHTALDPTACDVASKGCRVIENLAGDSIMVTFRLGDLHMCIVSCCWVVQAGVGSICSEGVNISGHNLGPAMRPS